MTASSRAVVDVEDCGCDTMGCSGGSDRSFLFESSTLVCDSYKKAHSN